MEICRREVLTDAADDMRRKTLYYTISHMGKGIVGSVPRYFTACAPHHCRPKCLGAVWIRLARPTLAHLHLFIQSFKLFSSSSILPSFKHVSPQLSKSHKLQSLTFFRRWWKASVLLWLQFLPLELSNSPFTGLKWLIVRGGWKSEISVRHTPCSISDAMMASLTHKAWKACRIFAGRGDAQLG